jgi:hypothetical protein
MTDGEKTVLESNNDENEDQELDSQPEPVAHPQKITAKELEALYDKGQNRLVSQKNEFLLPQIIDLVKNKKIINLRPEYQRRLRWNTKKKSLLIESLLMNVPIPPIFLFEHDYARYEVMDGQQRLNAIIEFFENSFKLRGLEIWPGLNGLDHKNCPPKIIKGLERRSLSAVIVLTESDTPTTTKMKFDVRRSVFERLNTGGQALNAQELRNCVFAGPLNKLILELSREKLLTDVFGIPAYDDNESEDGFVTLERSKNHLYRTMGDCQLILRFFALRKRDDIKGSILSILDNFMETNEDIDPKIAESYKKDFLDRLKLAYDIFGDETFRLPAIANKPGRLSRPIFDAVMVALDELWDKSEQIRAAAPRIKTSLAQALTEDKSYAILVGRPNTAQAIKDRIDAVKNLILETL